MRLLLWTAAAAGANCHDGDRLRISNLAAVRQWRVREVEIFSDAACSPAKALLPPTADGSPHVEVRDGTDHFPWLIVDGHGVGEHHDSHNTEWQSNCGTRCEIGEAFVELPCGASSVRIHADPDYAASQLRFELGLATRTGSFHFDGGRRPGVRYGLANDFLQDWAATVVDNTTCVPLSCGADRMWTPGPPLAETGADTACDCKQHCLERFNDGCRSYTWLRLTDVNYDPSMLPHGHAVCYLYEQAYGKPGKQRAEARSGGVGPVLTSPVDLTVDWGVAFKLQLAVVGGSSGMRVRVVEGEDCSADAAPVLSGVHCVGAAVCGPAPEQVGDHWEWTATAQVVGTYSVCACLAPPCASAEAYLLAGSLKVNAVVRASFDPLPTQTPGDVAVTLHGPAKGFAALADNCELASCADFSCMHPSSDAAFVDLALGEHEEAVLGGDVAAPSSKEVCLCPAEPVRVSFKSTPDDGHMADGGDGFGPRAEGWSFGWLCDGVPIGWSADSGQRNWGNHFDRYNDCAGEMTWEIAIAPGAYKLQAVFPMTDQSGCSVQGELIGDNKPLEYEATVEVGAAGRIVFGGKYCETGQTCALECHGIEAVAIFALDADDADESSCRRVFAPDADPLQRVRFAPEDDAPRFAEETFAVEVNRKGTLTLRGAGLLALAGAELQLGCGGCDSLIGNPMTPSSVEDDALAFELPGYTQQADAVLCVDGIRVGQLQVTTVDQELEVAPSGVRVRGVALGGARASLRAEDRLAVAAVGAGCRAGRIVTPASVQDTELFFSLSRGRYQVCFCDSTRGACDAQRLRSGGFASLAADVAVGSGLQCLLDQPRLLQPSCRPLTQGGYTCAAAKPEADASLDVAAECAARL